MYNEKLKDVEVREYEMKGEEEDEGPLLMDPRRKAYEKKFEKFVVQNKEQEIEKRDYPEEEVVKFDLSCVDFATSVNSKAVRHREAAAAEKARKVEEMFMSGQGSHAVPGHDEIRA